MAKLLQQLNENQGLIALLALLVAAPAFLAWLRGVYRKWKPSQLEVLKQFQAEVVHAENLQREIEQHTKWDEQINYYGEFLVRDASRNLPHTLERHSSQEGLYSIMVLTEIHREYLEFTNGSFGIKEIKQIGDGWYDAGDKEDGAVKVWAVFRLNYRDIVHVQWKTDEYWEWPQICCRFPAKNKFPFYEMFYAERMTGLPRPYFRRVCAVRDVQKRRPPS